MIPRLNVPLVCTIVFHMMLRSWTNAAALITTQSTSIAAFLRPRRGKSSCVAVNGRVVVNTKSLIDRFQPQHLNLENLHVSVIPHRVYSAISSSRWMSTTSGSNKAPEIVHINRAQMEEIIEDYENGGREESQYCIIDVRTEEEVQATGKLGEHVYTLPVQVIMQAKVFDMDPAEFEEFCQFPKPTMDETIVFSCAAGIRSTYACQFAAQAGYTKLINYAGGANEWFSF
jgi:rhodanese-related sulfurtransferase